MTIMWVESDNVLGLLLLLLPPVACMLWWWNEVWYVTPVKVRSLRLPNTKLPPGHLGLPFLGEILNFLWYFKVVRSPDEFINSKRRKYGDNIGAYRTHIFRSPSIIACSPSLCKYVLQSGSKFKQEWPTAEAQGADSVITLQGARHDQIKSVILPFANRPDYLAKFTVQAQPTIVAALQSWSEIGKFKAIHEVKKVMLTYTARYFANLDVAPRIDSLLELFSGVTEGFRAQAWNFPGTTYYNALKCRKKLCEMVRDELQRRRKNISLGLETFKGDEMDGLMHYKDKEGNPLSDKEIIDNILSSIHVGHAAVSYLISWSIYFLAKSRHVLQKLREENMELSQMKNGGQVTYEDITTLKYTNKVVDESLRMTNISGFVFRTATEDVEFEGYMIPKGWKVIAWLRHLHTSAENFDDPFCFNPDRWDMRPKHGTFLPFGGGARSCAGSLYARVNLALFLHHLSVGYEWELLNPDGTILYLSHPHPVDGFEISFRKR